MLEDFLYALNNFRRSKTRTFLSLLGIIIGVASVIVITSMGAASTQKISDTFGGTGLDVVSVSQGFMMRRGRSTTLQFNESFRETLFEEVKDIKKIWYKNSMNATITYGDNSASVSAAAIEADYLEMYDMKLESGSFFTVTDDQEGAQKIAVIGVPVGVLDIVVHPNALNQPERLLPILVVLIERLVEIIRLDGIDPHGIGAHLLDVPKPAQIGLFVNGKIGGPLSRLAGAQGHAPDLKFLIAAV